MRSIIRYFIKYPVLGNGLVLLIFLFGYLNFKEVKTTFFPTIESRMIQVSAIYPGASPQEIEEGITLKIEDQLKGLTGVERVTSTSSENFCQISVELELGQDPNVLLQEVKNKVDQVPSFPVGMEQIKVFKIERTDFVMSMALSGDVDLKTLKTYARRIERDLLNNPLISKVKLSGFPEEEIEVSVRENDLRAYGLTFSDVSRAVANANIKITGGKVRGSREEFLIRADNKQYYAADLGNIVLRSAADGTIVYLKDVAVLSDRWAEDPDRAYFNGKPAVHIEVQKTNQEDMFKIIDELHPYMAAFNQASPEVHLDVLRDGSRSIRERVDILTSNGLVGMILVVLLLSFSLHVRLSFWVALSIPLSFAGMIALAPAYGMTINVMSLLGMILVVGMLVDDGIVIAENIYQHYERGEKPIKAAVEGTMEVLPSVISAVLTTIVIFSTFFFIHGGIGDYASDLAFVVIATLSISLIEAIFILPAHVAHSRALQEDVKKHSWLQNKSEWVMHWLRDRTYAPVLKFTLHHPYLILAIPLALFIITIGAFKGSIIKTTFFPLIESDNINIVLEMPAGTPAAVTDSILAGLEPKIWAVNQDYRNEFQPDHDLFKNISRSIGPGTNRGGLLMALAGTEERLLNSLEIAQRIREKIGYIHNAEKLEIGGRGGGWGKPVSISLRSDNIGQLRGAKEELQARMREVTTLKDVVNNDPPGLQEIKLTLRPNAYALGLNSAAVMSQVRGGFYGVEAQRLLRGIDEVRIWVRYEEANRTTIRQLENMFIRLADGRSFPLSELADISIERGIMSVSHTDAQRVVKVEADLANPKDSAPDILNEIAATILPGVLGKYPDVSYDFEGQNRENVKTMASFKRVVPPILAIMFIVIVFTFRSFTQSVLVYLLIPFSFIGVAWGHYIQGYIISMLSFFGLIALIGIVVNDSLVFISTMNHRLKEGMPFNEALTETGLSRFRPIILTSLTTIAGLGPLIFETSFQAQFLAPMAISIAYGLAFGTVLTLILLPALLIMGNRFKVYVLGFLRGQKLTPEMVEPAIREEQFIKMQDEQ